MTEELNIEKFNPTVAELMEKVEATRKITAEDLTDKKQLDIVKRARIDLRNARTSIEKAGKELRADALKFQRAVIAKEDELIGIIKPEEERLKGIEEEAEHLALMKVRQAQLPERKERLMKLGIGDEPVGDDFLLAMDSVQFETYYNEQVAIKNERDRQEIQRKQDEEDKENARIKAEQDAREEKLRAKEAKIAEDKRKLEEEARAQEREEKARQDERTRLQNEENERKEREKLEKEEEARKAAEEKKKLERAKKYLKFLADNGYTKENANEFKVENIGSEVVLWKKIAVFKII